VPRYKKRCGEVEGAQDGGGRWEAEASHGMVVERDGAMSRWDDDLSPA